MEGDGVGSRDGKVGGTNVRVGTKYINNIIA